MQIFNVKKNYKECQLALSTLGQNQKSTWVAPIFRKPPLGSNPCRLEVPRGGFLKVGATHVDWKSLVINLQGV